MSWWVVPIALVIGPGILFWLVLARLGQLKLREWYVTWQQFRHPTPEFFRNLLRFTLKTGRLTRTQLAGEFEVSPSTIDRWASAQGFTPAMPLRRHVVKVLRREWGRDRRKG